MADLIDDIQVVDITVEIDNMSHMLSVDDQLNQI